MTKSNVIYIDFKNKTRIESDEIETIEISKPPVKRRTVKAFSKKELNSISKRIDEINKTLDLCDPNRDEDIILNLEMELSKLVVELSQAIGA